MPDGAFLFMMDVQSLYTNILHEEGKNAVGHSLSNTHSLSFIHVVLNLLTLVLNLNNLFNDEQFLQNLGCAMGTVCAPPYANIFIGKFENDHVYPLFGEKCPLHLRFIDAIFVMWTGSKQ